MEKYIKKLPPWFYYLLSLSLISLLFLNIEFMKFQKLYFTFSIVYSFLHIPAGLGLIFYSYSFLNSHKPIHLRLYPLFFGFKFPIPCDSIFYSLFLFIGLGHIVFFCYLSFYLMFYAFG